MQETLQLIYSDPQVNNDETMVPGSDLCDILGLFFDLAESMEEKKNREVETLGKFRIAYNKKVKREREAKEAAKKAGGEEEGPAAAALRTRLDDIIKENDATKEELEK